MPDAGEILGGRYRLVRPLGEGGMATIWAAEHLTMGNLVAVKIISAELVDCELAISRFTREARAAAKLRSPYVVQLFDHDVDPANGPYIAMELLEGENLADRLEREVTLSTALLSRIMQQVGRGLSRAHAAGIVHRDMKPDNIFLAVDDEGVETAKILDFGVAKADSPFQLRKNKTVAGALVGTLSYMSPEQAQGREVDHRTDLWALGVIAFEALVGARPFDDEAAGAIVMRICAHPIPKPSSINPGVPPGFDAWFAKACHREVSERFGSAEELAESLAEVCDAEVLCVEDVVEELPPPPSPATITIATPRSVPGWRKRPVLQLVDSELPPPPETDIPIEVDLAPDYFVSDGAVTVGPVGLETVKVGYHEGYVPIDALLWTEEWPKWRRAIAVFEEVPGHGKERTVQDLELIGPECDLPSRAPALPGSELSPQPAAPKTRSGSRKRTTKSGKAATKARNR